MYLGGGSPLEATLRGNKPCFDRLSQQQLMPLLYKVKFNKK